jgi:hypothetical protein
MPEPLSALIAETWLWFLVGKTGLLDAGSAVCSSIAWEAAWTASKRLRGR